jgi:hypothetical protein
MIRTIGSFVVMGGIALALITSYDMQKDTELARSAAESPTAGFSTQITEAQKIEMMLEKVRAAMAAAEARRLAALQPDPGPDSKALAEKWGVEVIGMSMTSAGYMLDFRFRVLDADKALPLFEHRIKPYVVADKSDIKLPTPMAPKVGAFRPTNRGKNIKADKTYYMVFANPDNYVKPGEKVSVVIGDFRAENMTVRTRAENMIVKTRVQHDES